MEEFLEILQKIVQKNTYELTEYEKGFLRARRSYLSDEEKKKFQEVLKESQEEISQEEESQEETEEETQIVNPKKKGRPKK